MKQIKVGAITAYDENGAPQHLNGFALNGATTAAELACTVPDTLPGVSPNTQAFLNALADKDYVTPEMYGAKGDGVADDTNAFRRMDGKTVYIPDGTYRVSSVTFHKNTRLLGAGMQKVIIQQAEDSNEDLIRFENGSGSGLCGVTLRGHDGVATSDYQALLKICTKQPLSNYSNESEYHDIALLHHCGSGLVLLGKYSVDPNVPSTDHNWVLQMHNITSRGMDCYCMIDETTDNKFSQLYLSGGKKAALLINGASSNLYSDCKLDVSGEVGGGDRDGAILCIRNCAALHMIGIDCQHGHTDNIKITGSHDIILSGLSQDAGGGGGGNGSGIKMRNCQGIRAQLAFYDNTVRPLRYVDISEDCYNITIDDVKGGLKNNPQMPDLNGNPYSCKILSSWRVPLSVPTSGNLISNNMPTTTDGWRISGNVTAGSGGLLPSGYFTLVGKSTTTYTFAQMESITLEAGHTYLVGCAVRVTKQAGGSVPYINLYIPESQKTIAKRVYAPGTETQFIYRIIQPKGTKLRFDINVPKADCTAVANNFTVVDLGRLSPADGESWQNDFNRRMDALCAQQEIDGLRFEYLVMRDAYDAIGSAIAGV